MPFDPIVKSIVSMRITLAVNHSESMIIIVGITSAMIIMATHDENHCRILTTVGGLVGRRLSRQSQSLGEAAF